MKTRILSMVLCLCMAVTALAADPETKWTEYVTQKPEQGYTTDGGGNVTISSAEGLAWLASVTNGLNGQERDSFSGKTVTLTENIDLSKHFWTPMGDFSGTFEGRGHSISGMTVKNTDCAGLFAYLKGTVQNLSVSGSVSAGDKTWNYAGGIAGYNTETGNVINCKYQGASSATGGNTVYAGGLVGMNKGAVENCYNIATVTASGSTNNHAGGVAGYNDGDGTVTNCYNTGAVTANGGNYSYAGGLAGFNTNDGTVTNCYNTGAVTASGTSNNGYNTNYAGGLLGRSNGGTMTNCYWLNTAASAAIGSGGGGSNVTNCASFTEEQGKGTDATFDYTIGTQQTGTLSDALNAWVQAQNPSNDYFGWTNLSSEAYPILKTSHTVTFDAKGGTVSPESMTVTSGDLYGNLPTPTREGNTLNGWFTEESGGTEVTSTTVVTLNKNHTLYAQWTLNSYTVTFNANGGSAVTELSIPYGTSIIKPADPTKAGYSFAGWYKDEGFASAWDFATDIVTSTMTLYAKWTEIPRSSGGGGGGGSSGSNTGSSVTASAPLPTAEQPNPPAMGTLAPAAAVDGDGNISVSVTEQDVKNTINAALALAKTGDNTENGIAVSIDLSALQGQFNTLPLTISRGAYQALTDAGVKFLEIKTPQISLSLDLQTLNTILQNMGDQITISAERLASETLAGAARSALGSRPAYALSIADRDKKVTKFGGGQITVSLPYTPANGENPAGLYAVYVDGTGGVRWLWSSSYNQNTRTLQFKTSHFSAFGIGYKEVPSFTDIASHWAKNDIAYAAVRGLMYGTSATTFSPDLSMTRGMFVTTLGRLADADSAEYQNVKFTDVSADAYYAPYVAWAAEKGITSGTSAAAFSPDKLVSRQEMAVFLASYAKVMGYTVPQTREATAFADAASISSFAEDAIKTMQMAGVMNGKSDNQFDPQGTATRAEVAAALHLYTKLVIDVQTA